MSNEGQASPDQDILPNNAPSYRLRRAVLDPSSDVEIGPEHYQRALAAWKSLAQVARVEESWESLIQNYLEWETEVLTAAVQSMVKPRATDFHDMRLAFARRLANLLQSCRAYLDHTPHRLTAMTVDGLPETFAALRSKAKNEHLTFRFMQALRNHAQHYGVPLHSFSIGSAWTGDFNDGPESAGLARYSVAPKISISSLREDKSFSKSVLKEVDNGTDNLDVMTFTRGYLEALGEIHESVRTQLQTHVGNWKREIRDTIARYAEANEGEVVGLTLAILDGDRIIEQTHISEDMLARIEALQRRNRSLVNLRKRYVTSEILP